MARYSAKSIEFLAGSVIVVCDWTVFLAFAVPAGSLAFYFYEVTGSSSFKEFIEHVKDNMPVAIGCLVACSILSGLTYLFTLIIRVLAQLLLCAVEIEKNTRGSDS